MVPARAERRRCSRAIPGARNAPAAPPAMIATSAGPEQLDLFAWTPKARPLPPVGAQLGLFGDDVS
jgi:hypothetical protein